MLCAGSWPRQIDSPPPDGDFRHLDASTPEIFLASCFLIFIIGLLVATIASIAFSVACLVGFSGPVSVILAISIVTWLCASDAVASAHAVLRLQLFSLQWWVYLRTRWQSLPLCVAHGDPQLRNVLFRKRGEAWQVMTSALLPLPRVMNSVFASFQAVLLDWESVGRFPVGMDLALLAFYQMREDLNHHRKGKVLHDQARGHSWVSLVGGLVRAHATGRKIRRNNTGSTGIDVLWETGVWLAAARLCQSEVIATTTGELFRGWAAGSGIAGALGTLRRHARHAEAFRELVREANAL